MNSPPVPQLMRVLTVCLLEPILIGTKIEFFKTLAIVTESMSRQGDTEIDSVLLFKNLHSVLLQGICPSPRLSL